MMVAKSVTGYGKCVTRYGILQICYGLLRKYHRKFRIIPLFLAISVTAERKRYKKKRKENSEAQNTTSGYVDKLDLLGNRNQTEVNKLRKEQSNCIDDEEWNYVENCPCEKQSRKEGQNCEFTSDDKYDSRCSKNQSKQSPQKKLPEVFTHFLLKQWFGFAWAIKDVAFGKSYTSFKIADAYNTITLYATLKLILGILPVEIDVVKRTDFHFYGTVRRIDVARSIGQTYANRRDVFLFIDLHPSSLVKFFIAAEPYHAQIFESNVSSLGSFSGGPLAGGRRPREIICACEKKSFRFRIGLAGFLTE